MDRLLRMNNYRENLGKPEYDHLFNHPDALSYFNGDSLAADAFMSKYSLKSKNGECLELTPNDLHIRLADEFARVESRYPNSMKSTEIYELLAGFKYIIPQGSPMFGIGNNTRLSSLGNCFVLGINHDSIPGISLTELQQREAQKLRAGTGEDLSHLRPKGVPVNNSAMTSSGPVPFMNNYSESTRTIGQDGRRGALMLTLADRHPDIFDFINAKKDKNRVTGANISVKVSDELMRAAKEGGKFQLRFPVTGEPVIKKNINAKKLFDNITDNAWESAEPGVLFWDKILRESPADCYPGFETISTNPCGEIPLCLYDSCRLMAINLYSYVVNPFQPGATYDVELFKKHVRYGQRLLDDLIDLEEEKIDLIIKKVHSDYADNELLKMASLHLWNNIREKLLKGRRTGLGITAEGDMLAAMGLTYGTPEASAFAENIHREMALAAYWSSVEMAKERGRFELFDWELDQKSEFIKRICEEDPELKFEMQQHGRRNIALMTIAPTGTVSLMAQTTSGIEPVFMIAYKRKRKVDPNVVMENVIVDNVGDRWITYNVVHPHFMTYLKANNIQINLDNDDELNAAIAASPYHKATSNDVDWLEKVRMQGRIQKWVDHSISVTINLPNNTTKKIVGDIYMTAWESGCKGCTIYRDGSRFGVLVAKDEKTQPTLPNTRPKKLDADVVHFNNNKEKWVAFVGLYKGWPYEIFTGKNSDIDIPNSVKNGSVIKNDSGAYDFHYVDKKGEEKQFNNLQTCFEKQYWNCAILLSKLMRLGYDLDRLVNLVRQLDFGEDNSINSWKNGVGRALAKYIPAGTKCNKVKCECGESFVYQEGCLTCYNCGNSKCS